MPVTLSDHSFARTSGSEVHVVVGSRSVRAALSASVPPFAVAVTGTMTLPRKSVSTLVMLTT